MGPLCLITIDGEMDQEMFGDDLYLKKVDVSFEIIKSLYPWKYIEGKGLTTSMDRKEVKTFLSVLEFLSSGKISTKKQASVGEGGRAGVGGRRRATNCACDISGVSCGGSP